MAVALGMCKLPLDLSWAYVFGAGLPGGIGLTMSIFMTNLAFVGQPELVTSSKTAVFLASLTAGAAGYIWLQAFGKPLASDCDADTIDFEQQPWRGVDVPSRLLPEMDTLRPPACDRQCSIATQAACRSVKKRSCALLGTVDCTQLISVRVANVGQVHCSHRAVTQARRVFNGFATMRDRRVVKFLHLLRRAASEANGAAVRTGRVFPVDRLTDAESTSCMPVEETDVTRSCLVTQRFACPERS